MSDEPDEIKRWTARRKAAVVRYLSDGLAIGSRDFVEELFGLRRGCFGAKRKDGARPIREAVEGSLFSLRALRVQAVE